MPNPSAIVALSSRIANLRAALSVLPQIALILQASIQGRTAPERRFAFDENLFEGALPVCLVGGRPSAHANQAIRDELRLWPYAGADLPNLGNRRCG